MADEERSVETEQKVLQALLEASSLLLPILLAKSAKKTSLDQSQSGNHGAEILKSEIRPEIHIKAMKIPHSVMREVAKREVRPPPPG